MTRTYPKSPHKGTAKVGAEVDVASKLARRLLCWCSNNHKAVRYFKRSMRRRARRDGKRICVND